jgi:magnesium chelatase family protein
LPPPGPPQRPRPLHAGPGSRYRARLAGPLLDRIDILIDATAVPHADLQRRADHATRNRVKRAYAALLALQGKPNARLLPREIDRFRAVDGTVQATTRRTIKRLHLSAGADHRILKLARTIADMGAAQIQAAQVAEAIQYRRGAAEG